jgi:GNAT superfamily N-acetyltransferase
MIREFKPEDLDKVIEILKAGFLFDEEDFRKDLAEDNKKFLIYEDKGIKGFTYVKMPNQETKECYLRVYVCPSHRRQGIGTALYNEMYQYLSELRPNMVITRSRVDLDNLGNYFKGLGFKKWYGLHIWYIRVEVSLNWA